MQQYAAVGWGAAQPQQEGYNFAATGGNAWGQQQAQPAAQQAAPVAQSKDVTLVVTGCTHATVGGIVRGTFQLTGENHGKPTYKKDGQVNGLDVMSYYWDERDGPGFCGWWFGPKVGGDQVWAYHTDKNASIPPQTGWKVPYDGAVDPTFAVAYKPKAAAGAQQQQAWGQQAQQQRGWAQQGQQQGQQQQLQQQQQMQAQRMQEQKTQMAQNAAKAEENKMRLQMLNQQRIEEQKKKMEEMKLKQQQLTMKRAEEAKQKEEELAAKKLEQQAVLNVRRIMQKFRASVPDKFEESLKELNDMVATESAALGSQKERITTEVQQAVEMKKKQAEQKEAENNRRRELHQKAVEKLAELEGLVTKAEKGAKGVEEEADPFTSDKVMKLAEIDACASSVEESGKESTELTKACYEFITKEGAAIKNTPVIVGEPAPSCTADLNKLITRLNEAKKLTTQSLGKAAVSKMSRVKKANAKDKYDKSLGVFKKYDSDKDGKLSRREISAFAKGEFKFAIASDALDQICSVCAKDAKGVDKSNFHRMRVMVGVAREAAMDAKRKASREEREKQVAKIKEKLQASIEKAAELIKEASEAVTNADKAAVPLTAGKAKGTATEMLAMANEVDVVIETSKKSLEAAKDAVKALAVETEPELKSFLTSQVKKLQGSLNPVEQRSTKPIGISTRFRAEATKKNTIELEKLRADGLAMIFHHQGAKKLMRDGLLEAFDKKKKGKVEESAFVKFFETCEMKDEADDRMSSEDARRLFAYLDEDGKGHLTKEIMLNLLRRFMKVVKASVMTEDLSTKSKPLRRINEDEVLECLTGPTLAEAEDISRIKVKAVLDDLEGWVTPVGTKGSVFLEDGGNMFKVVKETILTGSFVIGEDKNTKDRQLKVREVLEVREWPRKDEVTGLLRMKVRVKSDGQIGWVTSVGNTGIKFVEML